MALKPSQSAQFVLGPDVWQERFTISVSADDLRAIAKRGYEGAVTSDHDQQAQAVALFLTDALLQI
jgi:hypothetical protein